MSRRKFSPVLAVVILAVSISCSAPANARASSQDEVCDATADYFLGTEAAGGAEISNIFG
jgi:hypothetical protein